MSTSFADLKRSRKTSLDKLIEESGKLSDSTSSNQNNFQDNRFWSPGVDKAGNGMAVIRFLPAAKSEDIPWVRIFTHGFKGPTGQWYIENSLTTLGKKDPVSEHNTKLWNSGVESNKDLARKQKRRLTYISNIYIIKDKTNPDNEGKVFLYRYGKKIFDMLNDVMNPQFEDEDPINPFDFWEGANLKLKIRNVEGYRNYDKSEFENPSELVDSDDDKLQETWSKQHSLMEFLDSKNFKPYDELKTKLDRVLGVEGVEQPQTVPFEEPTPQVEPKSQPTAAQEVIQSVEDGSDDEDLSFFQKLAEED